MIVARTVYSKGGHSIINFVVRLTMLVWLRMKREEGPVPSPATLSFRPIRATTNRQCLSAWALHTDEIVVQSIHQFRSAVKVYFIFRLRIEILQENKDPYSRIRGVVSFTIFTINFSIHGSNKWFFDKLYEGCGAESSIYVVKITIII